MSPLLIITLFVLGIIAGSIAFRYLYNRATLSKFRRMVEKRDFVKYYDERNMVFKTGKVVGFFNVKNEQFIKVKTLKNQNGGFVTLNVSIDNVYPIDIN